MQDGFSQIGNRLICLSKIPSFKTFVISGWVVISYEHSFIILANFKLLTLKRWSSLVSGIKEISILLVINSFTSVIFLLKGFTFRWPNAMFLLFLSLYSCKEGKVLAFWITSQMVPVLIFILLLDLFCWFVFPYQKQYVDKVVELVPKHQIMIIFF